MLPFEKLPGEQGMASVGKGEQRQQGLGRKQEVSNTAEMLPGSGKAWLLARQLCALKNSKANNLNYRPASLGAADDAFVYLSPNVKGKIVFCLQGHVS